MERTLFVGVGGSGGETVRYAMRELDRRLRASGWDEGLPTAWQFVHIDVREAPDDVKSNIPAALGARLVHLGLGKFPLEYDHYARKLTSNAAIHPGLGGWLPSADSSQSPPYTGAGQRRAVGRTVAAAELKAIGDLLDSVTQKMSTGDADEELKRLAAHLDAEVTVGASNGLVFVINSLGGGAGSGSFLDVIQLLRSQSGNSVWLSHPYAVLYAPDVFANLPDSARRGIEANSLAAINELMAAYTHTGTLDTADAAVLQSAGGGVALTDRTGPEAAIVIGASSGASGVSFTDPGEIYESVGKALAALVGSDEVASQFDAYVRSNFGSASPAMKLPLTLKGQPSPISSLGYASVSLGKDLFAAYATERLANAVLRRLQKGYEEGVDTSSYVRIETLVDSRAQTEKDNFFRESGLWEVGKEHNQVLDYLRDGSAKRLALDELRDKMLKDIVKRVEASVSEWLDRINTRFDAEAKKFADAEAVTRNENATKWVADVQNKLLDATVDSISRNGFDVTAKLLDLLSSQIEDAERGLQKEREEMGIREKSYLDSLGAHFANLRTRARAKLRGDASSEAFKATLQKKRDALSDRTESDLRQLAHDLLVEVRGRLIPPLKAVVNTMAKSLSDDLDVPEVKKAVEQWSLVSVGKHLLPTPNEVLLTPVDSFPDVFDEVLSAMFEAPINDAVGEALEEIVRGGWASDENVNGGPQTLVATDAQWQPNVSAVRSAGRAVRPAAFSSLLSAERVYDITNEWVYERRGALADYLQETLGDWLTASPAELRKRGEQFRTALASALTRGKPLVSIDADITQQVHGTPPGKPSVLISPIPLDSQHPSYKAIEKLVADALPKADQAEGVFGVAAGDTVEIVTFPGGTVHPVAVGSLTSVIQDEWVSRKSDAATRSDFWEYRRARTLRSYVPLPPELQKALVQGWLIAQILNHLSVDGTSASIWTPDGDRAFPASLLTKPAKPEHLFPALLESYPLALLSFASGSSGELEAYNELIRLGGETSQVGALVPSLAPSDALSLWVRDGKTAKPSGRATAAAIAPNPALAGKEDEDAATRAETIGKTLDAAVAELQALQLSDGHDPRLEVRDFYVEAANLIKTAVVDLAKTSSTGPKLI